MMEEKNCARKENAAPPPARVRQRLLTLLPPHLAVLVMSHRKFVGGDGEMWEVIGRLQFDFLVSAGLKPSHVLLDVGCGSLRGGVHFIRYLEPGHYLGLERVAALVKSGIEKEAGLDLCRAKTPEFVISSGFEFDRFSRRPDFALAQSVFSHLTPVDIQLCLERLRAFVPPGAKFFATYHSADSPCREPWRSHPGRNFRYTKEELMVLGRAAGWNARSLGQWGHPRGQLMMEFIAARQVAEQPPAGVP